jgi:hypothetical protein
MNFFIFKSFYYKRISKNNLTEKLLLELARLATPISPDAAKLLCQSRQIGTAGLSLGSCFDPDAYAHLVGLMWLCPL